MELQTEARKKILEQAGISEEVISFLDQQEVPLLYEWSFLCAIDGMPLEDLKRICKESEKQRGQASTLFMEERRQFLQKTYENNRNLNKEVQDLLVRVQIMYERASALEEGLNGKLTEAMQEKDRVFSQMIQMKDDVIRDKEKQLARLGEEISHLKKENSDMKKEAAGLREENQSLTRENAGLKEKVYSLEDRLRTAEIRLSSVAKEMDRPDPGTGNKETPAGESASSPGSAGSYDSRSSSPGTDTDQVRVFPYSKYGYSVKKARNRHGLFNRGDREADEFIRLYIENKDYSEVQKQYLIECLEQGDPLSVIRKFASPGLSVKYMDQLRRILYERGY